MIQSRKLPSDNTIDKNSHNHNHLIFDKNKDDLALKYLKIELFPLSSKDNIEDLYHNFTIILSSSINKFSINVSSKKEN